MNTVSEWNIVPFQLVCYRALLLLVSLICLCDISLVHYKMIAGAMLFWGIDTYHKILSLYMCISMNIIIINFFL